MPPNIKKAMEHHEKALEIFRQCHGENYPYVARTLNNIGIALGEAEEPDFAEWIRMDILSVTERISQIPVIAPAGRAFFHKKFLTGNESFHYLPKRVGH